MQCAGRAAGQQLTARLYRAGRGVHVYPWGLIFVHIEVRQWIYTHLSFSTTHTHFHFSIAVCVVILGTPTLSNYRHRLLVESTSFVIAAGKTYSAEKDTGRRVQPCTALTFPPFLRVPHTNWLFPTKAQLHPKWETLGVRTVSYPPAFSDSAYCKSQVQTPLTLRSTLIKYPPGKTSSTPHAQKFK